MRIETTFVFHNVGQGLFYSGEIKLDKDIGFNFVYDCGSTSSGYIKRVVKSFKSSIDKNEIDLLVISHLHDDHTRGLNELLNGDKSSYCSITIFQSYRKIINCFEKNKFARMVL